MYDVNIERVSLKNISNKAEIEEFLQSFDLLLDKDVDYTIAYRENGKIKATASKAGCIFKCIAISAELRGGGMLGQLINNLTDRLFQQGISHSFIFTNPSKAGSFSRLGYNLVYETKAVALLENGTYSIYDKLKDIIEENVIDIKTPRNAVLVYGSFISDKDREEIKKLETSTLIFIASGLEMSEFMNQNYKIIRNMDYIFPYDVFPKYFIKGEEKIRLAFSGLNQGIFKHYFMKVFNLTKVYICEEI